MPGNKLAPADPRDFVDALAFACGFKAQAVHNADEIMVEIVAERRVSAQE